jgi:hypothetical protein
MGLADDVLRVERAFNPLQIADICAGILAIYAGNPDNFVLLR